MESIDMDTILSRLSKGTRKRVQLANEISLDRLAVPSVGLNRALKGGIGRGRQTLAWGSKSAGKSTFFLRMVAMHQARGQSCAWIDAEQSWDPAWALRNGVDPDKVVVSQIKTMNDMTLVGTELMQAGVDLLITDSISALLPGSYFVKDSDDLKELDNTKQIGGEARDMANAVKMLNYANERTALVLISQQRNKIETYGAVPTYTGGQAVGYFSSTVIKFNSSPAIKNQIMGKMQVGDNIIEVPVGRPVNWEVQNNKIGPQSGTGSYDLYYQGDSIGIDNVKEIVGIATEMGVIEKTGGWYTVAGQRIQGMDNVTDLVKSDPEIYASLERGINGEVI